MRRRPPRLCVKWRVLRRRNTATSGTWPWIISRYTEQKPSRRVAPAARTDARWSPDRRRLRAARRTVPYCIREGRLGVGDRLVAMLVGLINTARTCRRQRPLWNDDAARRSCWLMAARWLVIKSAECRNSALAGPATYRLLVRHPAAHPQRTRVLPYSDGHFIIVRRRAVEFGENP